jgi:hypothetical protein
VSLWQCHCRIGPAAAVVQCGGGQFSSPSVTVNGLDGDLDGHAGWNGLQLVVPVRDANETRDRYCGHAKRMVWTRWLANASGENQQRVS